MTGTGASRDLAVMTIVQDEPEFIHPWVNHYKKHVADHRDIFVLIHSRTPDRKKSGFLAPGDPWERAERTLAGTHRVNALPVHHAVSFDHRWLLQTVESFFAFLLQSYNWVLFAEADEFVLPLPGGAPVGQTLLDLVRQYDDNSPAAIRATGFEIVHQPGERALRPALYRSGRNVALSVAQMIENRGSWYKSTRYSKTVLARVPLTWDLGFHLATGGAARIAAGPPSSSLALLHLHKVDFDLALRRSRRSLAKKWSWLDFELGFGSQNRIGQPDDLRVFWETDGDTGKPLAPGRLVSIPHDREKRASLTEMDALADSHSEDGTPVPRVVAVVASNRAASLSEFLAAWTPAPWSEIVIIEDGPGKSFDIRGGGRPRPAFFLEGNRGRRRRRRPGDLQPSQFRHQALRLLGGRRPQPRRCRDRP